ncbi:MAG TPA: glycosyltransferase 87 family protein [Candidatus Baltobacteraceae bacterium]
MQPFLSLPRSLQWTVGVLILLLAAGLSRFLFVPFVDNGFDFQAFYCGGSVVAEHANPYLDQPLHGCETRAAPEIARKFRNVTVPAPLPPYALAFFIPLSLLPFAVAKIVWWLVLVASIGVCGWTVAKLTGWAMLTAFAASAAAIGATSLPQAGLPPAPIALLFLSAYFVSRRRWTPAALCSALAMIEPHVALPAAIALFLFVPELRGRLLLAGAALAALALAVSGPQTTLYYFTTLLPLHAASEVRSQSQFSLTTILYHLGASAPLAVRIGTAQYAVTIAFGVWLGWRLARRFDERAFLVAAPAACAVAGGSFIHLSEIGVAVLLACMLAARMNGHRAWLAVVLLAVPWEQFSNWATFSALAPICVILLVWPRWKPLPILLMLGSIVLLMYFVGMHLYEVASLSTTLTASSHIAAAAPNAPVDVSWQAYNDTSTTFPALWVDKSITFFGIGLLLFSAARATKRATAVQLA